MKQDFGEVDSDPHHLVGQIEDFAELPIPADQAGVLVEHGDALARVIERGLEDLAVVTVDGVGIVEELEGGLGR